MQPEQSQDRWTPRLAPSAHPATQLCFGGHWNTELHLLCGGEVRVRTKYLLARRSVDPEIVASIQLRRRGCRAIRYNLPGRVEALRHHP